MRQALDAAATDPQITSIPDFTVLLETQDGRRFTHSHGNSTATTVYESASTSKWVTATVIMDAVDQGAIALASTAHDLIPFWTEQTVTLEHLLSFTSGYSNDPLGCINLPNANFTNCVETIYNNNPTPAAAGTEFDYASGHLQVAGLMTINALGLSSWAQVFAAFSTRTGLLPTSTYDLPSASNPRLAGGMHWTGEEYLGLLRALSRGTVLTAQSRAALFASHRGAAVVAGSPTLLEPPNGLGEDWAYGLGNWLECRSTAFDCAEGVRNSSPGAYGGYPFIDFEHGYFGMVARQGELGTYPEGILLFRQIQDDADRWATATCP